MNTDIIVVGRRFGPAVWALFVSEDHDYELHPTLTEGGGSGGEEVTPMSYAARINCSSAASAVKALSDKIKTLPGTDQYEFSATIVGAGGGRFQPYLDRVRTIFDEDKSNLHIPANPSLAKILMHTHPSTGDYQTDLENRYPSPVDWKNLEAAVEEYPQLAGISIAIQDKNGDVRVFPYEDRGAFKSLSVNQKRSGASLPESLPVATGCS